MTAATGTGSGGKHPKPSSASHSSTGRTSLVKQATSSAKSTPIKSPELKKHKGVEPDVSKPSPRNLDAALDRAAKVKVEPTPDSADGAHGTAPVSWPICML